ncbi:SPOR domain-containing protein [Lachnospiraceae bacterium 29-84]
MAGEKESKVAGGAQETIEKVYKVTCGTFKNRNEALRRAAETRSAGVHVSLTICKTEYSLLYAEGMTKAEAEAAKKAIEAKKVKAEVSEQ